ncbi:MAG: hypothetical protein JXD19_06135 [Deltaproteobacteria bacterium]|nr:hypothetical protein [Deltaproteobacteria bacterium]
MFSKKPPGQKMTGNLRDSLVVAGINIPAFTRPSATLYGFIIAHHPGTVCPTSESRLCQPTHKDHANNLNVLISSKFFGFRQLQARFPCR